MCFIVVLQHAAVTLAWQMSTPPLHHTDWPLYSESLKEAAKPLLSFTSYKILWLTFWIQKSYPDWGRLPGQQTNRALFISVFSGHPQTQCCYIIHDFSFNRKVPFMLRSPSLAAHQIVITSCKAICLEVLCWWPPMFKRGPGLWPADDFSNPPT